MLDYKYSRQRGALHEMAVDATQTSVNLDAVPPEALRLVPALIAHSHEVLPITLDGETRTQLLTVIADPREPNSRAAIAAKTQLAIAAATDIDADHRAVNDIRARRQKLGQSAADRAQDKKLAAIEEVLMQVNMKGSEANLAFPGMLNEQLASFAGSLEDADTAPTTQQQALFESLHAKLQEP